MVLNIGNDKEDDMRKLCIIPLLIALLVLGLPDFAPTKAPAASPEKAQAAGPLTLAYYYPWFGDPGHSDDWKSVYDPVLGQYDAGDPEVIDQHFDWAKQARVDGFIVSWWNKDGETDRDTQKLFERCPNDFKLGIMVEQIVQEGGSNRWYTEADLDSEEYRKAFIQTMEYIVKTYYKAHPDKYLTWDGKPVIASYAFIDHGASESDYASFFEGAREEIKEETGVQVSFWSINTKDCSAFDVCAMYNPMLQAHDNPQCPMQENFYQCQSGVKLGSVFPGYDDTAGRTPGTVVDRRDGDLYREQWKSLLGLDPDIVFITSWNEWHEGTSIEPAKEWRALYLEITARYVGLMRTFDYLANSYNPALHLVYEAPHVASDVYNVSDNLLVQFALENYRPEISKAIRGKLIEMAKEHNLPTNHEGLPIDHKHEALIGEAVLPPFYTDSGAMVIEDNDVRTQTKIFDDREMPDWREYADLLCLAALSWHHRGEEDKAVECFNKAKAMWDGKGIKDKVFEDKYETYKLALLLLASRVLNKPLDFEAELEERIWAQQDENGGFLTHYRPDGSPDGDTNSETTAIVLLSFLQDRVNRLAETSSKYPQLCEEVEDVTGSPLFCSRDEKETGYSEFCNLVPFKGDLYFWQGPYGRVYRFDPMEKRVELVYQYPNERASDRWRATCWGSCVTKEMPGKPSRLFFTGFAIAPDGEYNAYVFRSDDGETFHAFKIADFASEAYSMFHFAPNDSTSELYAFVGDIEHGKTKVYKADSLDGKSWKPVYTIDEGFFKVGGAIEWYGDLWAVGQMNEPGSPSPKGVIIHYNPDTDSWSHKIYDGVGFYSIAKPFMNPDRRVYIGDTDGWIWVTHTMPPSRDSRLIRLDAPVLRIQWLTDAGSHYNAQLLASTGNRYGWGSLWLLDDGVYPERLVRNAYGGITGFAPLYNGVGYVTAWDTPGSRYDPIHHSVGGRGTSTAKLDYISPERIASASSDRGRSRQVIWKDAKVEPGDSAIISTLGWDSFEVYFKADAQGTLKIEYDGGPSPASPGWVEADTITVDKDEPVLSKWYPVKGMRARITFEGSGKVTAMAYLK